MANAIVTASYLRASSPDQTESIDAQRMLLERKADEHGLKLSADLEYFDFAISGDTFRKRDGLQRLMDDAKAGKFLAYSCVTCPNCPDATR